MAVSLGQVRRFAAVRLGLVVIGIVIYHYPVLHFAPQYWFWVLLSAPGLFLLALSFDGLRGIGNVILAFAPLVAIGRVSYGLYLYHLPIFWAFDTETAQTWTPIVWSVLLTTTVVSISWWFVEKPALRLKSAQFKPTFEAASGQG
ncbi:hypothetical protein L6654_16800 [Bradyrhizobium sp. WYCCWR 13023]|uniref:Acyltransferase 3 domain-containing protein n=1 Tax=Bradyrhizobium zhengyangense TaxID=2911009 RepID=A0A9X1UHC6_9BRAD|nr:hypothetical protein [Bradyrhizobium zhengyangense]MCG2628292.1 hypothetical protein [Bradyrhizobium zhengyangense]